ncbi:hypothetical protein QBC39DRAFT_429728 [Podospora conica]|nr:hypothetical protein QBC39DRAFT_429728 [Schizothecium conicum]
MDHTSMYTTPPQKPKPNTKNRPIILSATQRPLTPTQSSQALDNGLKPELSPVSSAVASGAWRKQSHRAAKAPSPRGGDGKGPFHGVPDEMRTHKQMTTGLIGHGRRRTEVARYGYKAPSAWSSPTSRAKTTAHTFLARILAPWAEALPPVPLRNFRRPRRRPSSDKRRRSSHCALVHSPLSSQGDMYPCSALLQGRRSRSAHKSDPFFSP